MKTIKSIYKILDNPELVVIPSHADGQVDPSKVLADSNMKIN